MKILIINEHIEDKLGGSEIQCDLIARQLVKIGHEVYYLAMRGKRKDYQSTLYKIIPVSEVNTKEFYEVIDSIKPDVIFWRYYKRKLYQVTKKLKKTGYPLIFSVSHEVDVRKYRWELLIPKKKFKTYINNSFKFFGNIYQFRGFYYVAGVVNQCRSFMGRVGSRKEIYFPNSMNEEEISFNWNRSYCVWVSNLKKRKNPEEFLYLAEKLISRDIDFLMVGAIQDNEYSYFKEASNLPENVKYLGPKSIQEVNGIIKSSMLLIHTCSPEGFPNNFIQAWHYGKPVVSLNYDPDNMIESERLGFFSRSKDQFVRDVEKLIDNKSLREEIKVRAKKISNITFDKHKNIKKLEKFMLDIIDRN
ncbi:MAG: glycosyltransferase family 4 protein [Balneolaceae bacterium]